MAKMTPERREIRKRRKELQVAANELASAMKPLFEQAEKNRIEMSCLQKSCPHPNMKIDAISGISFGSCPDCGYIY